MYQEAYEEAYEEAYKEGAREKQLEFAKALLDEGTLSFEKIAQCIGLTLEEVKSLADGKPL